MCLSTSDISLICVKMCEEMGINMEVYFGGAYQGKLDYVLDKKGQQRVVDGAVCNMEDIKGAQILNHLHLYIRRIISCDKSINDKRDDISVNNICVDDKNVNNICDNGKDNLIEEIYAANPDIILICDEVGSGIVPIEKKDRVYREAVGRALCSAVKKSDRVERIMCGIGQCLKDTNM